MVVSVFSSRFSVQMCLPLILGGRWGGWLMVLCCLFRRILTCWGNIMPYNIQKEPRKSSFRPDTFLLNNIWVNVLFLWYFYLIILVSWNDSLSYLHFPLLSFDWILMYHFFLLVKVWPYEETDEYGFVQSLFQLMHSFFSRELNSISSGPGVKLLKVGFFFFLEN